MKKIILMLLAAVILSACGTTQQKEDPAKEVEAATVENLIEVAFNVEGMTCDGCENAIMKSVESLEGVKSVESSHEEGWTKVAYDGSSVSEDDVMGKIADAGYEVTGIKK